MIGNETEYSNCFVRHFRIAGQTCDMGPKVKECFLSVSGASRTRSCSVNEVKDKGVNQIHELDCVLIIHRFDRIEIKLFWMLLFLLKCTEKVLLT